MKKVRGFTLFKRKRQIIANLTIFSWTRVTIGAIPGAKLTYYKHAMISSFAAFLTCCFKDKHIIVKSSFWLIIIGKNWCIHLPLIAVTMVRYWACETVMRSPGQAGGFPPDTLPPIQIPHTCKHLCQQEWLA